MAAAAYQRNAVPKFESVAVPQLDRGVFPHGLARPLTAAELEMMNLTGDGSGLDIVLMPGPLRDQVPTANFFERNGYEANPVVIRNNTVSKLLAATDAEMDENSALPGSKALVSAY